MRETGHGQQKEGRKRENVKRVERGTRGAGKGASVTEVKGHLLN